MTDLIRREDVMALWDKYHYEIATKAVEFDNGLRVIPSVEPETCEGCKHLGKWKNEVEYGYPSPCTRCKRMVGDNYER